MDTSSVILMYLCVTSGLGGRVSAANVDKTVDCADPLCQTDPLGFEAIVQLHSIIDDDHNGNLDRSESDGYFRDELKHEDGDVRQATFHGADDQITVNELWVVWTLSHVYNWTVEDVLFWLEEEVALPKYSESFRVNAVDGHILPRIAVNSNYVSSILDIKNAVHRQKLAIKATDLVLFGQKKKGHNWIKDLLLVVLFLFALIVAWLARRQNHRHSKYISRVMSELESLQKSEDVLKTLQHRYEQTKKEHLQTAIEKQHIEKTLTDEISQAKTEAERLRTTRETTEEEISRLKLAERELIEVRKALADSEQCCEQMRHELPPLVELQQWLQLTFEIETQHYEAKRDAAETHLRFAREMCERVRRKRSGLLGSLRIAHSTSLDDTDQSIMQARGALEEVKIHLQERSQRWQEIESICGFDVIQNPGLAVLETSLRGVGSTYLAGSCGGGMSKSASTSTFSAMSNLGADTELDEDISVNHLQAAHHPRDKRRTLADSVSDHRQSAVHLASRAARTAPLGIQRSETAGQLHANTANGAVTTPAPGMATANGDVPAEKHEPVKFGLHEDIASVPETDHTTFSQSQSVEASSTHQPRPNVLVTSRSDSALATSKLSKSPAVQRRSIRTPERTLEETPLSSHDSTDSLDLTHQPSKHKRKSGIKLPKIFKKKDV